MGPLLAVKLVFGIDQPHRQSRGSVRTASAGVATPPLCRGPVLCWRSRALHLELEYEYVAGESGLSAAPTLGPTVADVALARAAGTVISRLAQARLFHRDLKLSNLVVHRDPPSVCVIDTVGVRRMRRPDREIARMLERLAVELSEREIPLPRCITVAAVRSALERLPRPLRRAVLQRLRAHPAR